MDEEFIFKPTAFRHGVAEADIRSAFDQILFDGTVAGEPMREMTVEEAEYLDDLWTRTTPEIDTSRPGYFARKGLVLGNVAPDVAEYLRTHAAAARKTQAEIVDELVRKEIAAAMSAHTPV
jgi:hypothetical protein